MIRTARSLASLLALGLVLAACAEPASSVAPSASPSVQPTRSPTPEPTVSPTAEPASEAPSPSAGDRGELRPFAIAANSAADALFLDRDECANEADGYRLEFPDAWYTNTAVGDVEPCTWFSPTFYEVDDPSEVPSEIAITIEFLESDFGTITGEALSRDFGIAGGTQAAVRVEYGPDERSAQPANWRSYVYLVQLGPTEEEGPNLVLGTSTEMGGDYELNKAVLDRIVATLEFVGTTQ